MELVSTVSTPVLSFDRCDYKPGVRVVSHKDDPSYVTKLAGTLVLAPTFSKALERNFQILRKREDGFNDSIPGTNQSMTWLSGFLKRGAYASQLQGAYGQVKSRVDDEHVVITRKSLSLMRDAGALAPLNLTIYRVYDFVRGYGFPGDTEETMFRLVTGVKAPRERDLTLAFQYGAIASARMIDFAVETNYRKLWTMYDRAYLSSQEWGWKGVVGTANFGGCQHKVELR